MPRGLLEGGKRKRVSPNEPGVSLRGLANVRKKLGTEQSAHGLHRFERPNVAEDLVAVVSRHSDRRDLAGLFVDVQVGGAAHVDASVRKVHTPLGVIGKARKELVCHPDDFVGLFAHAGHSPRHDRVPTLAEHPHEGVAREGSGERLVPSHDHPGVQSPGQRHRDRLSRFEISREVARKNVAELSIVWFWLEGSLVLPLSRLEVRSLPLDRAVTEDPRRGARQHVNALEERPVPQDAPARDELAKAPRVQPPELGPHRQDRLGFRGEIEGLLRLVIVDPVQPIPVIEQRRGPQAPVHQESMKPSVQSRGERLVLLVEMDEVGGSRPVELVPPLLEAASRPRLGEFLPRED